MKSPAGALLRACFFLSAACGAHAQTQPVIIEAETGTLGTSLTTGVQDGATYVTTTLNGTTPPTADRIATYSVTFPAAGTYELYARYRIGPGGGDDDSFYFGQGFGVKTPADGNQWALQNTTTVGSTNAADTVLAGGGAAGTQVFKWVKLTGVAGPASWAVAADALTQTFQWGSREDGMFMDKLAFGIAGVCYTVGDLDAGRAASGTCPPPPPPDPPAHTRLDPPIATGLPKFLGSAWSPGTASSQFAHYWNQITPENGGKWGSVENTRDVMNFTDADAAYKLAKDNGFKFKWHNLVWGNQQPPWIASLSPAEQLEEINEWYAAIAARYPDIDQIDVVNEPLHSTPSYIAALGGTGTTGWDWVITAFTMARQYFPHAQLLINDYSITNDGNATGRYLQIIQLLQERGLIDGIGDQAHAFSTTEAAPMPNHRANLDRLAATGLPIYVTEFDLDGTLAGVLNHDVQLANYQRVFPVFWEHPAVKGVTVWGYVQGFHWRNAQGDWLMYQNGGERPALQWLIRYVQNQPATVTSRAFTLSEGEPDPNLATARAFLEQNGYEINDTTVGTAVLMLVHPETFVDAQGATWTGGLANYNGTNGQAIAFRDQYAGSYGRVVGQLVASDPDTDTVFSQWRVERGDGNCSVDPATGVLRVAPGHAVDFEQSTWMGCSVSVWDGYARSAPQDIVVNFTNDNDNAPSVTAGQTYRIDGGYRNQVAAIESSDPDDVNQLGFTTFQGWAIVSGNTEQAFRLAPATGQLDVGRPLNIDYRRSSYTLGMTVGDGKFTSAPQPVSISIPSRLKMCLLNVLKLDVPKATAPLVIRLGGELGACRPPN
jgi:endo-1,4-beta-xylanase